MIHIEKDKEIFGEVNLRIATATGDYEDSALIEFYDVNNPGVVSGSFQAQYIKYGSIVYRFSDPKELGVEILKIEPDSTHIAAVYARMTNELLNQMNAGSLETSSLDQVITDEQTKTEEKIESLSEPIPEEEIEETTESTETEVEDESAEEDEIINSEESVEEIEEIVEEETSDPEESPPLEEVSEEIPDTGTVLDPEVVPEDVIPDTPVEQASPELLPIEEAPLVEPVSLITRKRNKIRV